MLKLQMRVESRITYVTKKHVPVPTSFIYAPRVFCSKCFLNCILIHPQMYKIAKFPIVLYFFLPMAGNVLLWGQEFSKLNYFNFYTLFLSLLNLKKHVFISLSVCVYAKHGVFLLQEVNEIKIDEFITRSLTNRGSLPQVLIKQFSIINESIQFLYNFSVSIVTRNLCLAKVYPHTNKLIAKNVLHLCDKN